MEKSKTEFLQLQSDFRPGTVIDGKFEVCEYIDFGGMGYLFKGYHKDLHIPISIKVQKDRWMKNPQKREDFLEEGRRMVHVQHQYVARMYDVGEFKGHCYLVMDFIAGKNLFRFVEEEDALDVDGAFAILRKLAEGLASIHKQGIIHRDITPNNIMLRENGDPVLLDFGISQYHSQNGTSVHGLQSGDKIMGTEHFIAPECLQPHKEVTPAADIFALGKTLCFMLLGKICEPHEQWDRLIIARNRTDLHAAKSVCHLIARMTSANPKKRIQDGQAVLHALNETKKSSGVFMSWVMAMAGFMVIALGLYSFFFQRVDPKPYDPKPRIIALIPTIGNTDCSDIAFEMEKILRNNFPYYDIIDRIHIDQAIKELKGVKEGWISRLDAPEIGRLVGAHIFIFFEHGSKDCGHPVFSRACDVETFLLLGSTKIEHPQSLSFLRENTHDLINQIHQSLPFVSAVKETESEEITLKHGQLYGASKGMKVSVLNRKDEPIAFLEISKVDKYNASAKIIKAKSKIKRGMRVREYREKG